MDVVSNEVKPQQDIQEKSLVKRDLKLSQDKQEDADKSVAILRNDDVVSQNSENQTNLQIKEKSNQVGKDFPQSKEYGLDDRTLLGNHSEPLSEKSPKLGESIKIRDLKSNVRQKEKQTSSLSSSSIKSFISKQRSKRSRSRLQVTINLFGLVYLCLQPLLNCFISML